MPLAKRRAKKIRSTDYRRYRLSSPNYEIKPEYDVVVIGSGYGGSIAASRCARAGQNVCVLEKGKEWLPGDFPESDMAALNAVQMRYHGDGSTVGSSSNLFDVVIGPDVAVLQGCGLGGGSLINANVGLDVDPRVFADKVWPRELRDDMNKINTEDKTRVCDMLKPEVYPDHYPKLKKMDAMKDASKSITKDMEDLFKDQEVLRKAPLYVNFKDQPKNHVGIPQPACVGCGNCCGGCNTGAKNTLNMNYLPDAKAHGAEIFTEIEVKTIQRDDTKDNWKIHFIPQQQQRLGFHGGEQTIYAKHVILGSGCLGSTEILLRSQAKQKLNFSDKLGHRFTTNGDSLNFSYNGEKHLHPAGVELHKLRHHDPPGPSITSLIDLRNRKGETLEEGLVIQDGTPPCSSDLAYKIAMGIERGEDVANLEHGELRDFLDRITGAGFKKTLCFLSMGHDNSAGRLVLNDQGHVIPEYPNVGTEDSFIKIAKEARKGAAGLNGTFIENPYWGGLASKLRDVKGVITVHPLGGCAMAETGHDGVVNHFGQVFKGNTGELYPGLYVMDGAIMPRSLGVNPTMTIAVLAERCMRKVAEINDWVIDYESKKQLKPASASPGHGFRFTERMVGKIRLNKDMEETDCEFLLTVETENVEKMLEDDETHAAHIYGTVTCPSIATSPLTVSGGKFQLFSRSQSRVETREMIYEMPMRSTNGKEYFFRGVKHIHKDTIFEIGLGDTTKLDVNIFEVEQNNNQAAGIEGVKPRLKKIGHGQLRIWFTDFLKQVLTMEVFNTKTWTEKLGLLYKFMLFFTKVLWDVYRPFHKPELYDPSTPPRKKRPLNLRGVKPVKQLLVTPDQVEISVTRYNSGKNGPLLLVHGTGVSSDMFCVDTIDKNYLEYMIEREYDIWLLDWRASKNEDVSKTQWHIDDAAKYDIPTAVGYILAETKHSDLQVLVHCAGGIVFFASLLQGHLKGKIRSIVCSQTGPCLVSGAMNDWRSYFYVPHILHSVGIDGLTAYTDTIDHQSWFGYVVNKASRFCATLFTDVAEHCTNPVCHRVTLTYHLLWNHANLNPETHQALHEYFGFVNSTVFKHFAIMVNKGHLISYDGQDVYMPGHSNKSQRLDFSAYTNQMKLLDIPTLFFSGQNNVCWDPQTSQRSYNACKEANPDQEYQRLLVQGYSHLDIFMGKRASEDVFPLLVKFIEKYSTPKTENKKQSTHHYNLRSQRNHGEDSLK